MQRGNSSFYGLPVKNVLNAPCIKKKLENQQLGDGDKL